MVYSDIRTQARDSLRGYWGQAIAVTVIASLLGGGVAAASFNFNLNMGSDALQSMPDYMQGLFAAILGLSGLVGLVQFIIGGTVQLGFAVYLLKRHHRMETEFSDLFSQFFRFSQGFVQKFLCGLYTFLWALLLVIPGIVKSYSYAMTPFILADHPNMTANEAITRSRQLMDGHKWQLFVLELTFLGWELLAALTLGIGMLWVVPYMSAARAAFYRQIAKQPRYTVE